MTPSGSFFMESTIEISIPISNEEQSAVLIALLSEFGFEGFLEEAQLLKAYIPESLLDRTAFEAWFTTQSLYKKENLVAPTNWNQQWESGFQPVEVGNFAIVRASFHPKANTILHDIIINPKMSFGTGHHATTYMMIEQMSELDFHHKEVLDYGTGTGVLAILAKKMNAAAVVAIDNDEWSIDNAKENFILNDTTDILLNLSTVPAAENQYDIILANINKSVILRFLPLFSRMLRENGVLLVSGILEEDVEDLTTAAQTNDLKIASVKQKSEWMLLQLVHSSFIA